MRDIRENVRSRGVEKWRRKLSNRPRSWGPHLDAPHLWTMLFLLSQINQANIKPATRPRGAGRILGLAPSAVNSSRKMQLFVYKLRLVIVLEASDSGAHGLGPENIMGRKIMCEL